MLSLCLLAPVSCLWFFFFLLFLFFLFCSDSRAREFDAVQPRGLTSLFADLLTDRLTAFALPFTLFAALRHHRFLSGFCQKFPTKLSLMQIACTLSLSAVCVCVRMFVSLEGAGASAPPTLIQHKFSPSFPVFLFYKLAAVQVRLSCSALPGCALPPSLFHLQLSTELQKVASDFKPVKLKMKTSFCYFFILTLFLCA